MTQYMRKLATLFFTGLWLLTAVPAAEAELLDVGPVVPQVLGSEEGTLGLGNPPLGHGFPLWYRDTNRVPLELCLNRLSGQCATFEPNTGAPLRFPDPGNGVAGNFSDEAFWWSAEATGTQGTVDALLVMALEAAFSTGDVVPGAQISFGRIRIRVDNLPSPGTYTVTTPYREYTFNVVTDPKVGNEINFTEDLGIAEGGVFTGALHGAIGPFLYCTGAPFTINGGLYLAPDGNPCTVLGSTFPSANNPSNFFRITGPGGFNMQINEFVVSGKIYTGDISTPLTVDRVTYTRDATGTQVNAYATTQAMSNQRNSLAAFPGSFALTNAPSVLEVTGTGIPTMTMTTNDPRDGKFFAASGLFPTPGSIPATVTVTNTADDPDTARTVPLVDEVVIDSATYNPLTNTLAVSAASYDRIAAPALQAFMSGMTAPLGTLSNGRLSVTIPLTDTVANPDKTYNIPPATVTVVSALGGSSTIDVASVQPNSLNNPPQAIADSADVEGGGTVIMNLAANDVETDGGDSLIGASLTIVTQPVNGTLVNNLDGTVSYTATAAPPVTDTFTYTIRDSFGAISNTATVTVNILDSVANVAPVAADDAVTTAEDTALTFSVTGNDTDANGNLAPTTVVLTSTPANGTAVAGANGLVTYTPASNFAGTNTFTYTVKDSLGVVSNAATVTVTVTAINDAPVANNDTASTSEENPVTINVAANDTDVEGTLVAGSVAVVTQPANGTVVANGDGTVTYTPNADFFGNNTFTYTVSDGTVISSPATVTVTVNPVNDAPTAVNDVATVPSAIPIAINVLANDTDIDGTLNTGSVAVVGQPANGTATVNPAGTITYTSNTGFTGTNTFTYTVRDNNGAISNTATVTVTVTAAASETVNVLRAQYRASTREWRIDGAITNRTSTTVTLYIGRDLTGAVLASNVPVLADGTWTFRLNGTPSNPVPDASNTISAQGLPGGGSRLAFPIAAR